MRPQPRREGGAATLQDFRQAVIGDLRLLARLHEQEPDRESLEGLRECHLQDRLGLCLSSEIGRDALALVNDALAALPRPIDQATLDALAAEYANIYLTYAYRASPSESVWLDEDGLERQTPMFQVREWYRRHDVAVVDAFKRPDDHLVFQLQFLAHLFETGDEPDALGDVALFMDEHLLRWVGQFGGRVASRCQERFFAGLGLLTAAYLEELRDLVAKLLQEPRPARDEIETRMKAKSKVRELPPAAFVPGSGPGW